MLEWPRGNGGDRLRGGTRAIDALLCGFGERGINAVKGLNKGWGMEDPRCSFQCLRGLDKGIEAPTCFYVALTFTLAMLYTIVT